MSKFNNSKVTMDGIRFDSKGEAARYQVLKQRQDEGVITGLRTHVPYTLTVNGQKICVYKPDFVYCIGDAEVVEDFKSKATMTATFRLKAKLMKACHNVTVKVVFKADEP